MNNNKTISLTNSTNVEYPKEKTIIQVFEDIVKKNPESIAIRYNDNTVTFSELNIMSNKIGNYLRENIHVEPNEIVALMFNKSIEMIAAILGVLKAGAAYLPIDPTHPEERVDYYLNNANVAHMLTDYCKYENNFVSLHNIAECVGIEDNPPIINTSNDLCYTIFTSGTTGDAKAVMIKNTSVVNLAYWEANATAFDPAKSRMLQFSNYIFDASVWEIFSALLNGIRLEIVPEDARRDPRKMLEYLQNSRTLLIPSYFRALLQYAEENNLLHLLGTFEKLALGAEEVHIDLVQDLKRLIGNKIYDVYNYYGPTETTSITTSCRYSDKYTSFFPIGKPISNVRIYIIDKSGRICNCDREGEICIAGTALAEGYLKNEVLTEEKFVNISVDNNCIERVYKTGDLGEVLSDGNIRYLGRIDHQVKIRGYRIELGEIESKIRELDYIRDAVVITHKNGKDIYLCAYLLAKGEIATIKDDLRKVLPEYMLPRYYITLERFPETLSGKLDRKILPLPVESIEDDSNLKNEDDNIVLKVFKQVIGDATLTKESDFFEVGGNSITAIGVISKLKKMGYKVDVNSIFKYQTAEQLMAYIEGEKDINVEFIKESILNRKVYSNIHFFMAKDDSIPYELIECIIEKHIDPLLKKNFKEHAKWYSIDKASINLKDVNKQDIDLSVQEIMDYMYSYSSSEIKEEIMDLINIQIVHFLRNTAIMFTFNKNFFDDITSYNYMKIFTYLLDNSKITYAGLLLPISYNYETKYNLLLKGVLEDYDLNHRNDFWNEQNKKLDTHQTKRYFMNAETCDYHKTNVEICSETIDDILKYTSFSIENVIFMAIARAYLKIGKNRSKVTVRKVDTLSKFINIDSICGKYEYEYPIILEAQCINSKETIDELIRLESNPNGLGYYIYSNKKNTQQKDQIYDFSYGYYENKEPISKNCIGGFDNTDILSCDMLQMVPILKEDDYSLLIIYNTNLYNQQYISLLEKEIIFQIDLISKEIQSFKDISKDTVSQSKYSLCDIIYNTTGVICLADEVVVDNKVRKILLVNQLDEKVKRGIDNVLKSIDIIDYPDYIVDRKAQFSIRKIMTFNDMSRVENTFGCETIKNKEYNINQFDKNITGTIINKYMASDIQLIFLQGPIFIREQFYINAISPNKLLDAIQIINEQQSALRTSIDIGEEPVLCVHKPNDYFVAYYDGRYSNLTKIEDTIKQMTNEQQCYQDYKEHSLCRIFVIRITEKEYKVCLFVHHCIWDNTSTLIFKNQIEEVLNNNKIDNVDYSLYAAESHRLPDSESAFSTVCLSNFRKIEQSINNKGLNYIESKTSVIYLNEKMEDIYNTNVWNVNMFIVFIIARANGLIKNSDAQMPVLLLQDDRKFMENDYTNTIGLCLDMIPILYNVVEDFNDCNVTDQIIKIESEKIKDHFKYFKQTMRFNYEQSNVLCLNFVNAHNMDFNEIYKLAYQKQPEPSLEVTIYAYANYLLISYPIFDSCNSIIPELIQKKLDEIGN